MPQRTNSSVVTLSIILLLGGLFGCTQKLEIKSEVPEDIIPRDSMVSIFVDLRLLDAVLNFEQLGGSRKVSNKNYFLYGSILDKYCITREQFERSFDYYQNDLEVLDEIYADAITRLSMLKSKVEQDDDQGLE